MIAQTLTVPASTTASPSFLPNDPLFIRNTPSPTCCTDQVVLHLTTTLVISDYHRFYKEPVEYFKPSYLELVDGLFYLLLASQLLAPICYIPWLLTYFDQRLNCNIIIYLSEISSSLSIAFLLTGILGIKAYRCLDNSRLVLVVLAAFQAASVAVVVLNILRSRGRRRITGSCLDVTPLKMTRIYVILQFAESLFLCFCFLYAVYRSHGLPAARGRISITLSLDDPPQNQTEGDPNVEQPVASRGWWDYVPKSEPISIQTEPSAARKHNGLLNVLREKAVRWREADGSLNRVPPIRKQASNSGRLTFQPLRPSSTHNSPLVIGSVSAGQRDDRRCHRSSPTPSSFSRLSKLMPRMLLFQAVMKDELCYTAFITATYVVVAILSILGVNVKNSLPVTEWIGLNWVIISVLTIHSFGRVVRRHEREAMLHDPSTWDAAVRAEMATAEAMRNGRSRRPWSPVSVASHLRDRRVSEHSASTPPQDPFRDSLQTSHRSWRSARHSDATSPPSPLPTFNSILQEPLPDMPTILPSPMMGEFSTSGRNTPITRHDSHGALILSDSFIEEYQRGPDGRPSGI